MSGHLDAPGMKPPGGDARIDITDIYIFRSPDDPEKSIMAMCVNPLAPTMAAEFAPDAFYEMNLDTNADAIADVTFHVQFSPLTDGQQRAIVKKGDEVIIDEAPVSFDRDIQITATGRYRFYAGLRSDAFFFDLQGFERGHDYSGSDFFADKNVFAIVLEVPNSDFDARQVGFWCRVTRPTDGKVTQVERMGKPLMTIAFLQGEDKDAFNRTEPKDDQRLYRDKIAGTLIATGRYEPDQAARTAGTLLPDILIYDCRNPAGYPNGRQLTDDIIDIQLATLTNGAVISDLVGPHTDHLPAFPYLGDPHRIS